MRKLTFLNLIVIAAFVLAACAAPAAETVVETVVVKETVEVEVVKEVEVEVEPELPSMYSEAPMLADMVAAGDIPSLGGRGERAPAAMPVRTGESPPWREAGISNLPRDCHEERR